MATILIVDDDVSIGNMEQEVLTCAGYHVLRAYSGTEALLLLGQAQPDLVLLDLMLPGLSGEALLPQLKGIPVIVVSAKIDVQDKVELLLSGAADYLTKPFDTKELLARVAVRLRERSAARGTAFCVGDVTLDPTSRAVTVNGTAVALTRTEFAILKLLLQNAGACKILPARPYRRRHAGLYRKLAENSRQPSAMNCRSLP